MNMNLMKLFYTLIFLFVTLSINAQDRIIEFEGPIMTFEHEHLDFGEIERGAVIDTSYTFVNTGKEAAEIEIVSGCECTTLDYPSSPIPPGEKATIHVKFDSTEKEESETVDVDIILKNLDANGNQIMKFLSFEFILKD